jgi:hypothetical protein
LTPPHLLSATVGIPEKCSPPLKKKVWKSAFGQFAPSPPSFKEIDNILISDFLQVTKIKYPMI